MRFADLAQAQFVADQLALVATALDGQDVVRAVHLLAELEEKAPGTGVLPELEARLMAQLGAGTDAGNPATPDDLATLREIVTGGEN
jgi:hypothetical protein